MDNTMLLDEILELANQLVYDKNYADVHISEDLGELEQDGLHLAGLVVALDKAIVEGRWLPKRWQQQLPPGWKLVGPLDHPDCPFSLESDENPK